jgi:hypothetical protein
MHRSRKTHSIARQATDLAIAAPQVMAHRLSRIALAGVNPDRHDRQEFARMILEKQIGFGEAWIAMTAQGFIAAQTLSWTLLRAFWMPWLGAPAHTINAQLSRSAHDMLARGMAPLTRRAVANSKRLTRSPR